MTTRAILAAILTAASIGTNAEAQTFHRTVTYCNRTPEALVVAVGYDKAGTSQSTSQGWFGVAPCACRTILNDELRATEIFVMAAKKGTTTPLIQGTGPLCIHPTRAFLFRGENANQAACQQAGGTWTKFVFHDTGTQTSFQLNYRRKGGPQCNLD
jgi:uncharacterized membrane protein